MIEYNDNKEKLLKDEVETAYKSSNIEMLSLLDVTGNKYAKEYLTKLNNESEADKFRKKQSAIHNTFNCYYSFKPDGEYGYNNFIKYQNIMKDLNVTKDDLSNPKFNNTYSPAWSTPCASVSKGTTQCDISHLLTESEPLRLTNKYYGYGYLQPYTSAHFKPDPRLLTPNGPIVPSWGRE